MARESDKLRAYSRLVKARKACNLCIGLTNPSQIERGCFDKEHHIGPWSRWQGNLSADLMLIGQDWGDTRYFRDHGGLDEEHNPTNRTLVKLLGSIGIVIGPPGPPPSSPHVVFFTNAVLCLKEGGLQGAVRSEWFSNCAPFLRSQVEIISPRVVVAMGNRALRSVRGAFNLPNKPLSASVAVSNGEELLGDTRLFAVYHCGARVLNTHRPYKAQEKDWKRIGSALGKIRVQRG